MSSSRQGSISTARGSKGGTQAPTEKEWIKKSVVLHEFVDRFVRQTQSILLEEASRQVTGDDQTPVEATYSAALNFMLLGVIHEAGEGQLSQGARDLMWEFVGDRKIQEGLREQEKMRTARTQFGRVARSRSKGPRQ